MPFHVKKSEPLDRAVRRVCREHICVALARLRKPRQPAAAIHGVRKEIKKLRAILRLVRGEVGRDTYRKLAKTWRRTSDQLAASRDARVMLQAFEALAGGDAARRFPGVQIALQRNCRRAARHFRDDEAVVLAKQHLRKTRKRLADLKFGPSAWDVLEPALRQTYQRGQAAGQLARQQTSSENLHAWRRLVKTLGFQLRLLCPRWPAGTRAMIKKLDRLSNLLGAEHDLFLLEQFIQKPRTTQAMEAPALPQMIASRREKLAEAALKLGARLYAKTPPAMSLRLGNHRNAWRSAGKQ